jgi:hypothetical protein
MTYDPDFDIPIEKEWLILMKQAANYNIELWLTKRIKNGVMRIFIEVRENDDVIYENNGLDESTEPFFQTKNFLKRYLEVEYL